LAAFHHCCRFPHEHFAQILGVETRGKRGRPREVTEHHGQLSPLGAGWDVSRGNSRRGRVWRQCLDRVKQLPSVAD